MYALLWLSGLVKIKLNWKRKIPRLCSKKLLQTTVCDIKRHMLGFDNLSVRCEVNYTGFVVTTFQCHTPSFLFNHYQKPQKWNYWLKSLESLKITQMFITWCKIKTKRYDLDHRINIKVCRMKIKDNLHRGGSLLFQTSKIIIYWVNKGLMSFFETSMLQRHILLITYTQCPWDKIEVVYHQYLIVLCRNAPKT